MSLAMKQQPVLETERLLLRPFELTDAPMIKLLAGDFAIADTTLLIPHPYEDGVAEGWIATHQQKYERCEAASFAITLKPDEDLIGTIHLVLNPRFKRAELGYWIGKKYWNSGYCTEAGRAVVEFGFQQLSLNKIFATHISRNPASGRVLKKLGMAKEGSFKEHVRKWDQFEDLEAYGILKSTWMGE